MGTSPRIFCWYFYTGNIPGGTGLGQVGILTNIAEDYSIAGGTGKASQAKTQIFKDKIVVCDSDSSNQFYTAYKEKTNTFSISGKGDVRATHMIFGLHETVFQVEVQNLKTVSGEFLHDVFEISTFAPAPITWKMFSQPYALP